MTDGPQSPRRSRIVALIVLAAALIVPRFPVLAADLSRQEVRAAIDRGIQFLVKGQQPNGAWQQREPPCVGITSLCVLALLNGGMTPEDPPVKNGLRFLRSLSPNDLLGPQENYQTSLLIMALAAAKQKQDRRTISYLAQKLEAGQLGTGGWSYTLTMRSRVDLADQSNSQFAILGLQAAHESGYRVDRNVLELARSYWEGWHRPDGGWGYAKHFTRTDLPSTGSMTVAGITSMVILDQLLKKDEDVRDDGTPPCCDEPKINRNVESGLDWMGEYFTVQRNPGATDVDSHLYYIYGLERAGRMTGQRFFGDHDWYREGSAQLLSMQKADGQWRGAGREALQQYITTSFSVLFLSKGLTPVLINKLKHGARDPNHSHVVLTRSWNRHPRDVRNLTELVSSLPKWPGPMTSQELDLTRAVKADGLKALQRAPILFITGNTRLNLTDDEIKLIKAYLEEGGFLFACPSCRGGEFETSFRELVVKVLPPGQGNLEPLPAEHLVYRCEYPLPPETVPLLGADFGCRTSIIYSPEDLGCYWDYWAKFDPPDRKRTFISRITRATQIGVNVVAYFTGREPPEETSIRKPLAVDEKAIPIERSALQIAQIRHEGAWNAAPHALQNLLTSLNETADLSASTQGHTVLLTDKNIFRYPVLYMHGRSRFTFSNEERQQLKQYLERGGVLVVDACCSSKKFDESFREVVALLFPKNGLRRIPLTHELFSERIGHEINLLDRRTSEAPDAASDGTFHVISTEPLLEGIEIDDRFAVIYSKYDISCALNRQNLGSCEGYVAEDAIKLATNIILYSMLQSLRIKQQDLGPGK